MLAVGHKALPRVAGAFRGPKEWLTGARISGQADGALILEWDLQPPLPVMDHVVAALSDGIHQAHTYAHPGRGKKREGLALAAAWSYALEEVAMALGVCPKLKWCDLRVTWPAKGPRVTLVRYLEAEELDAFRRGMTAEADPAEVVGS